MINNTILVLGFLVAIIPFYGLSHGVKEGLAMVFGVLIIGLCIASERKIIDSFRKKRQNNEATEDVPPVSVPLTDNHQRN